MGVIVIAVAFLDFQSIRAKFDLPGELKALEEIPDHDHVLAFLVTRCEKEVTQRDTVDLVVVQFKLKDYRLLARCVSI